MSQKNFLASQALRKKKGKSLLESPSPWSLMVHPLLHSVDFGMCQKKEEMSTMDFMAIGGVFGTAETLIED